MVRREVLVTVLHNHVRVADTLTVQHRLQAPMRNVLEQRKSRRHVLSKVRRVWWYCLVDACVSIRSSAKLVAFFLVVLLVSQL